MSKLWCSLVFWVKEIFRGTKEHLVELSLRPPTAREYGMVNRLPSAIAAATLTVIAIKAAEMGALFTLPFIVTMVVLAVITFSWAARGGENDYVIRN